MLEVVRAVRYGVFFCLLFPGGGEYMEEMVFIKVFGSCGCWGDLVGLIGSVKGCGGVGSFLTETLYLWFPQMKQETYAVKLLPTHESTPSG